MADNFMVSGVDDTLSKLLSALRQNTDNLRVETHSKTSFKLHFSPSQTPRLHQVFCDTHAEVAGKRECLANINRKAFAISPTITTQFDNLPAQKTLLDSDNKTEHQLQSISAQLLPICNALGEWRKDFQSFDTAQKQMFSNLQHQAFDYYSDIEIDICSDDGLTKIAQQFERMTQDFIAAKCPAIRVTPREILRYSSELAGIKTKDGSDLVEHELLLCNQGFLRLLFDLHCGKLLSECEINTRLQHCVS